MRLFVRGENESVEVGVHSSSGPAGCAYVYAVDRQGRKINLLRLCEDGAVRVCNNSADLCESLRILGFQVEDSRIVIQ